MNTVASRVGVWQTKSNFGDTLGRSDKECRIIAITSDRTHTFTLVYVATRVTILRVLRSVQCVYCIAYVILAILSVYALSSTV